MTLQQTLDKASASKKTATVAIRHRCPPPLPLPLPAQSFISMLRFLNIYMPPAIVVIIVNCNGRYKKNNNQPNIEEDCFQAGSLQKV
jgi:hypothetical protein